MDDGLLQEIQYCEELLENIPIDSDDNDDIVNGFRDYHSTTVIQDNNETSIKPSIIIDGINVIAQCENIVLSSINNDFGNAFTIVKPEPIHKKCVNGLSRNINTNNISPVDNIDGSNNNYSFCSICGLLAKNHYNETHRFFRAFDLHRCIHCNKFFYQHDHSRNPCWKPYKYL